MLIKIFHLNCKLDNQYLWLTNLGLKDLLCPAVKSNLNLTPCPLTLLQLHPLQNWYVSRVNWIKNIIFGKFLIRLTENCSSVKSFLVENLDP